MVKLILHVYVNLHLNKFPLYLLLDASLYDSLAFSTCPVSYLLTHGSFMSPWSSVHQVFLLARPQVPCESITPPTLTARSQSRLKALRRNASEVVRPFEGHLNIF